MGHTAAAISDALSTMLDTWHIEKANVHVIVRDNARNMIKAMEDSGLNSMAHTLQLAVNEGVLSQRSILEITAIGRTIVGHFKHSPTARFANTVWDATQTTPARCSYSLEQYYFTF